MYFVTEDPPLKKKGYGLSVLMYNILVSLKNKPNYVFTFNHSDTISKQDILQDALWEVMIFDRSIKLKKTPILGRFKAFQLIFSFLIALPKIKKQADVHSTEPVFISVGASARPILYTYILSFVLRNDLWLYIVDDFKKINELNGNKLEQLISNLLFKKVIKSVQKVLVISPGLREKYLNAFGIDSQVLLPCFDKVNLPSRVDKNSANDSCIFVFSGGLSMLYNDTLKLFADQLQELKLKQGFDAKLIIQTYSSQEEFIKLNFPADIVEYRTSIERSSSLPSFKEATCFIIPYSFNKAHEDLVSTSFPQKVAELIQLNRPILFLGPHYSSVINFFSTHRVPFVVNEKNLADLPKIIQEIEANYSDTSIIESYRTIYEKYFSPQHVREVLTN